MLCDEEGFLLVFSAELLVAPSWTPRPRDSRLSPEKQSHPRNLVSRGLRYCLTASASELKLGRSTPKGRRPQLAPPSPIQILVLTEHIQFVQFNTISSILVNIRAQIECRKQTSRNRHVTRNTSGSAISNLHIQNEPWDVFDCTANFGSSLHPPQTASTADLSCNRTASTAGFTGNT